MIRPKSTKGEKEMQSVNKRVTLLSLALVLLLGLSLAACPRPVAPAIPRVAVYGALHEWEIKRLVDAFTAETGIEAVFIRMSAGALVARIKAEAAAPMGDVFLGGPALHHAVLAMAGLLEPYKSPAAAPIPTEFKDPEGYWTGFYLGAIGFAVNKRLVEDAGLPYPETWDDLLAPHWKGEIMHAKPHTSGTAYTIVATLLQLKGEEAGWEFMRNLHANILFYTKSGAAPARKAAVGEIMIGISFGHDILRTIAAGHEVKLIYPADGTGWEIGAVSIIRGGPNLVGAKAFVDWMLTKEAQQLHTDLSFRISTHPDVVMLPGTIPLADIKLIDFDFEWAAAEYGRITRHWRREVEGEL